jgi:uncharacterized repeat protein (TIGR01451 family)
VRLFRRPRVLVVLALQAAALGLLATGALGNSKDGPTLPGSPQIVSVTSVEHSTSVPLADAPAVPTDPNRTVLEVERHLPSVVAATAHDPAVQNAIGGASIPGTTTSFQGLSYDPTIGLYPPDTVGDVGPTQYVQATNGAIDVFSKTGDNLTGATSDASFWSGLTNCDLAVPNRSMSDPTVNYDQFAGVWVYSQVAYTSTLTAPRYTGPYTMCVAVSTTGDATGTWNRYAFGVGNSILPDYPKLGVWPDGYYISTNNFDSSGGFYGAGAIVLERSAMLAGATSPQALVLDLKTVAPAQFGMLPSDADGANPPPTNAPNYFLSSMDDTSATQNDQLGVWAFHVDWSSPGGSTFTSVQNLNVPQFDGNGISVPQPGTGVQLDGLADGRLMNRLQYRNFGGYETLVVNETVKYQGVNAPRWYELRQIAPGTSWSLPQSGTYAPDALNRWMGSVAMNGVGEMALGYSAGDASTAPSLRYTGRVTGDGAGTMPQGEGTLVAGGGVQTGTSRWGDYSQLTVDPVDDCTFWYTGEYYGGTGGVTWTTRIGSFKVSTCTAPALAYTAIPTISGAATEGTTLTATAGTWSPAATSTTYQWSNCATTGVSCSTIGGATNPTYTLQPADAGRRVRVKVTAMSNAVGPSSVVSASTATVHALPPVNSALPSVSGTMQMGQTAAAVDGAWSSYASVTTSFAYQWQRCTSSCNDIAGANQSTYAILDPGDVGAKLRVVVTATNNGGTTAAASPQSATVLQAPAPSNLVAPSLSGSRMEAGALTVQNGTWGGVSPITYTYQWQTCTSIGSNCVATSWTTPTLTVHTLTSSDIGTYLRVVVTASNAGGATAVNTPLTTVILPKPPVLTGSPLLSGSATLGSAVTTTDGTWTSSAAYTISYQWQSCAATCLNIIGATTNRFDVTSAVSGTTVRAVVTATNAGGSTSASTGASAAVPAPPASSGGGSSSSGSGSSSGSSGGGSSSSGGGAGSPDLAVTGFPSNNAPLPGANVTFMVTVTNKNGRPAQNLYLNVTLGAGLQYVASTADRGNGCTATSATTLTCFLDWLSSDVTTANLQITTKVIASSSQTLSATATAAQGDSDNSNNTLTVALNAATSTTTTTSGLPVGLNGDGTPTTKQDKKKPSVQALYTSGKRGGVAKLRFKIYDDQGVAKAMTTIKRGATVVGRTGTGYGPVAYGSVYYVGWHVPAKAQRASYWFCVVAYDRAGNKSAQSCAPLALK